MYEVHINHNSVLDVCYYNGVIMRGTAQCIYNLWHCGKYTDIMFGIVPIDFPPVGPRLSTRFFFPPSCKLCVIASYRCPRCINMCALVEFNAGGQAQVDYKYPGQSMWWCWPSGLSLQQVVMTTGFLHHGSKREGVGEGGRGRATHQEPVAVASWLHGCQGLQWLLLLLLQQQRLSVTWSWSSTVGLSLGNSF